MSRILIIGAHGRLGSALVEGFRQAGHSVTRGVRSRRGNSEDCCEVDLDRPRTLTSALFDADIAVSTIRHPQLAAERTALCDGEALLVSVASLSLADRRALEQDGGAGRVVVHAGLNPGLMTLILTELLTEHPQARRADLFTTIPPLQTMGAAAFDSVMPFLRGLGRRPVIAARFPEPIGRRWCVRLGGRECGWLADLPDHIDGHVWLTFGQQWFNHAALAANRAGVAGLIPRGALRLVEGRSRVPLTDEPKRDWVSVSLAGRQLAAGAIDGCGDYRTSVAAIIAQTEAILEYPPPRGAHGLEHHLRLTDIEKALRHRQVSVTRTSVRA